MGWTLCGSGAHTAKEAVGADEALRLLLAYNREDVINMKCLLDYALPRLRDASGYTEAINDARKGA